MCQVPFPELETQQCASRQGAYSVPPESHSLIPSPGYFFALKWQRGSLPWALLIPSKENSELHWIAGWPVGLSIFHSFSGSVGAFIIKAEIIDTH